MQLSSHMALKKQRDNSVTILVYTLIRHKTSTRKRWGKAGLLEATIFNFPWGGAFSVNPPEIQQCLMAGGVSPLYIF